MKRTRAVKASVSMLANEVAKRNAELEALTMKYRKVKGLLNQALSHRYRLEQAVKAIAVRDGTCWCGAKALKLIRGIDIHRDKECVLHTVACDQLYLALFGAERGE